MNCYMFISLLWRDHIGRVLGNQVKHDYKIDICCFSAKSVEIRRKSKDLLARNQDNVSKWSNMSTHELFKWTITIQLNVQV
jgi:hypothetical protein